MTASCDWVIEFRSQEGNGYVRMTTAHGKSTIANAGEWHELAEGSYKECQGNVRAGKMQPRPLESCVKRVSRIVQKEHYPLIIQARIKNIHTGETIMGDLFVNA